MAPTKDKWVRRFVITDTSRHKKGFTIYKVTSLIFLKSSPDTASKVSVWKRYNDFKKLYHSIHHQYKTLSIKEPFPVFSKPKYFGRFEAQVVNERRECAVKLLEFIGRHSALFTSDIFVKFFESSLQSDTTSDCSQSIGSDTSEEDRNQPQELSKPNENLLDDDISQKVDENLLKNQANFSILENQSSSSDKIPPPPKKPPENIGNQNFSSDKMFSDSQSVIVTGDENSLEISGNSNKLRKSCTSTSLIDLEDFGHYVLVAAAHMSAGYRHESMNEHEEAFMQYKLGITNLQHGVQIDPDPTRQKTIQKKIQKYSERAEMIYNRYLNSNISLLSKPVVELKNYKVIRVMNSVMVVKDTRTNVERVIKTIEKSSNDCEEIGNYILRGRVPFMTKLHAFIQTETTIFLILNYVSNGRLWDVLKKRYGVEENGNLSIKKNYVRSSSCDALFSKKNQQLERMSSDCSETTIPRSGSDESSICATSKHSFFEKSNVVENISKTTDCSISIYQRNPPSGTNQKIEINQGSSIVQDTVDCGENSTFFKAINDKVKNSNPIISNDETDESLQLSSEESLRRLEEEFGANSIYNTNLPTTKLLEKSQELMKSVDATIRKSNSIADRLNDSEKIAIENKDCIDVKTSKLNNPGENNGNSDDEFSPSNSSTESFDKIDFSELSGYFDEHASSNNDISRIFVTECFHHESGDDSGVEMEQEIWKIPENYVRQLAAQLIVSLEFLHQQDVIVKNLQPDNLLINNEDQLTLCYVVPRRNYQFTTHFKIPYTAPELCNYLPDIKPSQAADIWSFGVILYELLTGIDFQTRHPGSFYSHSLISIPNDLPKNAKNLLLHVLRFECNERFTINEIKQHPFFEKVDWNSLKNCALT